MDVPVGVDLLTAALEAGQVIGVLDTKEKG
jgi:hypothetical protein